MVTTPEQKRAWKQRNRDYCTSYGQEWRARNPDYNREWHERNAEQVRARKAARYLAKKSKTEPEKEST